MFKYNYEYNLQLDNQPPDFYKQIIFYRRDIEAVTPKANRQSRTACSLLRLFVLRIVTLRSDNSLSDIFTSCSVLCISKTTVNKPRLTLYENVASSGAMAKEPR